MDRKLEALVRRDQNGLPIPPTQEEIAKWSSQYGSKTVQQAVQEIRDLQWKARTEGAKADEQALRQKQTEAAIETARAQAEIARQKAQAETQAQAQATEATRLANEKAKAKQQSEEGYRGSPLGMGMTAIHATSPLTGMALGYGLSGKVVRPLQTETGTEQNRQRQALGDAFDKINPNSRTAPAEYGSVAEAADASHLVPGASAGAKYARGIGRYLPYGLTGAFMGLEGGYQRHLAQDPDLDPFSKDAWESSGTANMIAGATMLGTGAKYAANPAVLPDADALRKIALARQYAKDMAANPPEPQGLLPPSETRALPAPVVPFAGPPKEQAREISRHLGYTPTSDEGKTRTIRGAMEALENADPNIVAHVASRIEGAAGSDPVEAVRGYLTKLAETKSPIGRIGSALLGAAGVGAAGATMAPGEAEAASIMPGVREPVSSLNAQPSRGEEAVNKALGIAKGIGEAAPYAIPGVGEGLMARDLAGATDLAPSSPRPKAARVEEKAAAMQKDFDKMRGDENLAAAQRQDARQRAELGPQREPIGTEAARAVPSEVGPRIDRRVGRGTVGDETTHQSAFVNPEQQDRTLPDWAKPYFAAGLRAHARGEHFYGGTPEYDADLAAFKQLHQPSESRQVPGEAPIAPTAPEEFKHGGKVTTPESKKLGTIGDAFQKKLDSKETVIASLEKALARKPNAKLNAKLIKEKAEADRIRAHIEKVKSHG